MDETKTEIAGSNSKPIDIDALALRLGLQTELAKAALPVVIAQIQCLDRKQQDYGPGNLLEFGAQGVLVRLSDKRSRIVNLRKLIQKADHLSESTFPKTVALNESEADSWLDLSNYAVIGYLMVNKLWPKP